MAIRSMILFIPRRRRGAEGVFLENIILRAFASLPE